MTLERNANGTNYCNGCRCIVILFDDDTHECPNDDGHGKWERMARIEHDAFQQWQADRGMLVTTFIDGEEVVR